MINGIRFHGEDKHKGFAWKYRIIRTTGTVLEENKKLVKQTFIDVII